MTGLTDTDVYYFHISFLETWLDMLHCLRRGATRAGCLWNGAEECRCEDEADDVVARAGCAVM